MEITKEDRLRDLEKLAEKKAKRMGLTEYTINRQSAEEPAVNVVVAGDPEVYPRLILNERDLRIQGAAEELAEEVSYILTGDGETLADEGKEDELVAALEEKLHGLMA